jgi:hypothetical protein
MRTQRFRHGLFYLSLLLLLSSVSWAIDESMLTGRYNILGNFMMIQPDQIMKLVLMRDMRYLTGSAVLATPQIFPLQSPAVQHTT